MAVHPPTGPFPPNDGSNIFRRGMPKPTAKPIPPADDAQEPFRHRTIGPPRNSPEKRIIVFHEQLKLALNGGGL